MIDRLMGLLLWLTPDRLQRWIVQTITLLLDDLGADPDD